LFPLPRPPPNPAFTINARITIICRIRSQE
jgi:hypothetical protein